MFLLILLFLSTIFTTYYISGNGSAISSKSYNSDIDLVCALISKDVNLAMNNTGQSNYLSAILSNLTELGLLKDTQEVCKRLNL